LVFADQWHNLVVGNAFAATWALCIVFTLATLLWLARTAAAHSLSAALIVFWLIGSKAFFDFSVSGLENPLSHFMIVGGALLSLAYIDHHTSAPDAVVATTAALTFLLGIYLARPDLIVLSGPTALYLIYAARGQTSRLAVSVMIASTAPLCWTLFSLCYYGYPWPNAAYAKLYVAIPWFEKVQQGAWYFTDSFARDPLTLLTICAGVVYGWRRGNVRRTLAVGIVVYLFFLLAVGGDFMSGRLLSAPFVAASVLLAEWLVRITREATPERRNVGRVAIAIGVALIAMNLVVRMNHGVFLTGTSGPYFHGVSDEREHGQWFSLRRGLPGIFNLPPWVAGERSVFSLCGGLGIAGLKAGPSTHIIDECALADPLLSRIPPKLAAQWRPGHFPRQLPSEYMQSVRARSNDIIDLEVRQLYERVRHITRDDIFSTLRWQDILSGLRGNQGLSAETIARYRSSEVARTLVTPIKFADEIRSPGRCAKWDTATHLYFEVTAQIALRAPRSIVALEIVAGATDNYDFEYSHNGQWYPLLQLPFLGRPDLDTCDMVMRTVRLAVPTLPTSLIRVSAGTDRMYAIGGFRVIE
jgi:arabinofuranosyltransferase